MPVLRGATGPRGSHLSTRERLPPLTGRTDPPDQDVTVDLLVRGELEVIGRLVDASNATLLAEVALDGVTRRCVYKPVVGERPLWDFPTGTLARREVAAYELSRAGGWHVVPPTVMRDGPLGRGSVQLWVDEAEAGAGVVEVLEPDELPPGWLEVLQAESYDGSALVLAHADDAELAGLAVFDAVANNADRKVSHVLRDPSSRLLHGVDHGLTFNVEPKLRTVLWGWAGRRLRPADVERLERVADCLDGGHPGGLGERLEDLLSDEEVDVTRRRVERLLSSGRFPRPRPGRYPAIPWPPV